MQLKPKYNYTIECSSSQSYNSDIMQYKMWLNLLIAYRQVLRKASFIYFKCCSLPMAEATSIEFSHIIQ